MFMNIHVDVSLHWGALGASAPLVAGRKAWLCARCCLFCFVGGGGITHTVEMFHGHTGAALHTDNTQRIHTHTQRTHNTQ